MISARARYNWNFASSKVIVDDEDRHVLVWEIGSGNEMRVVVMNLSKENLSDEALRWRMILIARIVFPIPEPFTQKNSWSYNLNTDDPSVDPRNTIMTEPVDIVECTPKASQKWELRVGSEE